MAAMSGVFAAAASTGAARHLWHHQPYPDPVAARDVVACAEQDCCVKAVKLLSAPSPAAPLWYPCAVLGRQHLTLYRQFLLAPHEVLQLCSCNRSAGSATGLGVQSHWFSIAVGCKGSAVGTNSAHSHLQIHCQVQASSIWHGRWKAGSTCQTSGSSAASSCVSRRLAAASSSSHGARFPMGRISVG